MYKLSQGQFDLESGDAVSAGMQAATTMASSVCPFNFLDISPGPSPHALRPHSKVLNEHSTLVTPSEISNADEAHPLGWDSLEAVFGSPTICFEIGRNFAAESVLEWIK